jgi:hypothetical protein
MTQSAENVRYCYECGSPMRAVWQTREGKSAFTWFECTREGCGGVYLMREHPDAKPWLNEIEVKAPAAAAASVPMQRSQMVNALLRST